MSSLVKSTLPWESAPLAALVKLAWPIVVSMLSVSTMALMDTFFVSKISSAAVAGVGVSGILVFSLWCFPLGLVRSVKILISQAVGAGKREQLHPYLGAALLVAAVLGLLVMAIGVLGAPLLARVTATEASGAYAAQYLSVRAYGSVIFMLLVAIEETRQGLGDSRSVMYTTLLGNGLNIVLDYVFILHLGWGVPGAAWASNIGLLTELIALSWLHSRREGFHLVRRVLDDSSGALRWAFVTSSKHVRSLLRIGIPSGIQFGMEISSFGAMVVILSSFSELHTAAHQIAVQVLHFAFLPALAIGEAGSVMVGQAVGAGRPGLVPRLARLSLGVAWTYAAVCGSVMYFGSTSIASAFTSEAALLSLTVTLMTLMAIFQFFDAASMVARGVLRGTGDVRFVAVAGIVAAWVCTPPLTYLLGVQLGWGVLGAWTGVCCEIVIINAVLWRRLASNAWRRQALFTHAEPSTA